MLKLKYVTSPTDLKISKDSSWEKFSFVFVRGKNEKHFIQF